jgi:hypothetical protein
MAMHEQRPSFKSPVLMLATLEGVADFAQDLLQDIRGFGHSGQADKCAWCMLRMYCWMVVQQAKTLQMDLKQGVR